MNLKKKIEENEKKYIKPYIEANEEIDFINSHGFLSRGFPRVPIKLTEYQEEYLVNIRTHKVCTYAKCRQCGMTTLWLLHQVYELHKQGSQSKPKVLYVAPNTRLAEEAKDMFKEYCSKVNLVFREQDATFIPASSVIEKTCSKRFDEILFDDFTFAKTYGDVIHALLATQPRNITLMTCGGEDLAIEKLVNEISKSENDVSVNEIHWWECPKFNKNLSWKKIEVEPIIDSEGNVKYNKEAWNKRIEEGWIPTSPVFEKLITCLGGNEDEYLN